MGIFFKDKQGVLKGPYSEREIQEWYRKKWFDSHFRFYFVKDDESLSDSTDSFTLDELIRANGVGSPFTIVRMGSESASEALVQRLDRIEKDLAALKLERATIELIEKRVGEIEKELESQRDREKAAAAAPTRSQPAAAAAAAQPEKKTLPQLLLDLCSTVCDYGEILRKNDVQGLRRLGEITEIQGRVIKADALMEESPNLQAAFTTHLLQQLGGREYFLCSFCKFYAVEAKHLLMHLMDPIHGEKMDEMNSGQWRKMTVVLGTLLHPITGPWMQQVDREMTALERKKRSSSMGGMALCGTGPNGRFIADYESKYKSELGDMPFMYGPQMVLKCEDSRLRMGKNDLAKRMLKALHADTKKGPMYCYTCLVELKGIEEFDAHYRSYVHLRRGFVFDFVTHCVTFARK